MKISKFSSLISQKGIARPVHYYVEIRQPKGMLSSESGRLSRIALLCERTQLPGRIINSTKHMIYGVERSMPFGVQYQELPMTFMCTDDMEVRSFFDNWHSLIVNMNDNTFNYYDDYTTDIFITKVNHFNEPTAVYWIKEAYPSSINAQQLSYADKDYLRLDINFSYYSWLSLQDISLNNFGVNLPAIEKITGDLQSSLESFPPSNFNLNQLASQFVSINNPISTTFEEAQRIVQNYAGYLKGILSNIGIRL